MAGISEPLDTVDLVERYEMGESPQAIADDVGISRTQVRRVLAAAGVQTRGSAEVNRVTASRRSPEARQRIVDALVDRTKGKRRTVESISRGALTRQERATHTSSGERQFAEWLAERGLDTIPQQAIGPYNVDLGARPVAVEIFGGGWHGDRAAHHIKRSRYILDNGWALVVIWDTPRDPLTVEAADYVIAFSDLANRDPATAGQYRVVRGCGEELARGERQLDELALVPPRKRAPGGRA